jgi:Ca2+-binding RTX toxin-like protein
MPDTQYIDAARPGVDNIAGPALGPALAKAILAATGHLATKAAATVSPTAAIDAPSTDLVDMMNYLLGNILGLDRSSKLVEVVATRGSTPDADPNGTPHITIELKFSLGAWPEALLAELPSSILSIDIDPAKLARDRDYAIKVQDKIQARLDDFVADYVGKAVGNVAGFEHGVAAAAAEALKHLLASEIMKPLANELADSLLDLDLPDRADVVTILSDGFDSIRDKYVAQFVPELAKTYAKVGLSEILTTLSSGLDPKWAGAISEVGHGILDTVIGNMVDNYFQITPEKDILDGVKFTEVLGTATANLLIDFRALDKKIVDDILGIDGHGVIDKWLTEVLNGKIDDFVTDKFIDAFRFLAGDIEAPNLEELFSKFAGQFSIAEIRELLGDFFINYAGNQLAQLFVNIDSLPEALVSQLGSVIGSGVLGEAIGSITMGAVGDLFGIATWGAIGTSIFNGLGAILGAGVGAVAGSVVFELLDDLFDGAISGFFNHVIDWIRNDSPQAFYGVHFDSTANQFVHGTGEEYSKDSNNQMRAAVKALSDAFSTRVDAIIDFVGQKASFDAGYDNVYMVWGKKHYDSKYASFIGGNESNRLGYSADPATVAVSTIGGVLHHMNFHSGNAILSKAFDMWKAQIAAGGGGEAAFASPNAFTLLQNIVGLAHFANAYRQDPTVYDELMASDAPIAITILQEFLEAQSRGFNDATTLRGSSLGLEEIGSAAAGDTIILDGPAWRAIARGGDDTIHAGAAHIQSVDGGTGNDTLILAKSRDSYVVTERRDREAVLFDSAGGIKITVANVEVVVFKGVALHFGEAFPYYGGTGNDWLRGDPGIDHIFGNDGDDLIESGGGPDRVYGGAGNDSIFGGAGNDTLGGDAGDDLVDGGAGADTLYGWDGNDRLLGGADNDLLLGDAGDDVLDGGAGEDTLWGFTEDDILSGGEGSDLLYGESGNDLLRGGDGADIINGGDGDDMASYDGAASGVTVDLSITGLQNTGQGFDALISIEKLAGSDFDDRLTGNAAANLLVGGGGNDSIFGAAGDDSVWGGEGDDLLDGGGGDDTIDGGSGNDTASYASAATPVEIDLSNEEDQVTRGAGTDVLVGIENVTGSAFDDSLAGDAGSNLLFGAGGADTEAGGEGHDSVWGGAGDDLLDGGPGDDTIDGGAGNDTVSYAAAESRVEIDLSWIEDQNTRGAGIDTLISIENVVGSGFDDALTGNHFANRLAGGGGADLLTGGEGGDRFVYLALSDSTGAAADLISDFGAGDRIDLSALDADSGTDGDQAFHLGTTAGRTGDIRLVYDSSGDRTALYLYVDDDTVADATIWLAGNQLSLTSADFVL